MALPLIADLEAEILGGEGALDLEESADAREGGAVSVFYINLVGSWFSAWPRRWTVIAL